MEGLFTTNSQQSVFSRLVSIVIIITLRFAIALDEIRTSGILREKTDYKLSNLQSSLQERDACPFSYTLLPVQMINFVYYFFIIFILQV